MPHNNANLESGRPRTAWRFVAVVLAGSVALFLAWCAIDFVLVRFAPSRINDFDWLLFLLPIAVGLVSAIAFRHVDVETRIALSFGVAVLASIIAVGLVVVFGIPFHFSIGGKL